MKRITPDPGKKEKEKGKQYLDCNSRYDQLQRANVQ